MRQRARGRSSRARQTFSVAAIAARNDRAAVVAVVVVAAAAADDDDDDDDDYYDVHYDDSDPDHDDLCHDHADRICHRPSASRSSRVEPSQSCCHANERWTQLAPWRQ